MILKRIFDVVFSGIGLVVLAPLMAVIMILIRITMGPRVLFRQVRAGQYGVPFTILKFRTMRHAQSGELAIKNDAQRMTAMGSFLRKCSLDELPELWNVFRGEMSLVGPRPCLPDQWQLIQARQRMGVFNVRPGITGLAQIQGIDMSAPDLLAKTDAEMIRTMSLFNYFKYIVRTICGSGFGDKAGESFRERESVREQKPCAMREDQE